MSIALLATVFVGFARSFFLRPLFPSWPAPAEPVFYLHGVAFTAWFVLLAVQSWLIGARQLQVHRRLGDSRRTARSRDARARVLRVGDRGTP